MATKEEKLNKITSLIRDAAQTIIATGLSGTVRVSIPVVNTGGIHDPQINIEIPVKALRTRPLK